MYSLLSRNEPIYFPVGDSFQHMGNSRVSMSVSNMDKTFPCISLDNSDVVCAPIAFKILSEMRYR